MEGFEKFSLQEKLRELNMGRGLGKVYKDIKNIEREIS
jgi:hypothetical protein